MRKNEIKVGERYNAKVNNRLVVVRVDRIQSTGFGRDRTSYHVTNLSTGRGTVFHSAQKFRSKADDPRTVADVNRDQGREMEQALGPADGVVPIVNRPLADELRRSLAHENVVEGSAPPHLIVIARAGTGKTTTLVEGLKRVRGIVSQLVPSPQQAAVWEQMELSRSARSVCFVAFNKAIATELQSRVPPGCDAMTMHSLGYKAVRNAFGSRIRVSNWRVQDIISEITGRDIRELRKHDQSLLNATERLVDLCKMNLTGAYVGAGADEWNDALSSLASYYDVDLNGSASKVFELVPQVLERCKDVSRDRQIDFADMIWLPVVLGLPVNRYDLLLVDEAQDLNRCQQALARRAGNRLVLCGDPRQAIYGFAGADAESMPRMERELAETPRGCVTLPLTVTRRCGKAIVEEAKQIVPDFEAFDANGAGKISRAVYKPDDAETSYSSLVSDGDMILCRVNAPLVSQCFRFLKAGRKANIQGRDVGQGLISTIKKLRADDLPDLLAKLSDWFELETEKVNRLRFPNENRLIALQDRYDCLQAFCEDQTTIDGVIQRIESIFTDDRTSPGIKLSSIHKAKGLESTRVFILQFKGSSCPHPMAKSPWQKEQESNLLYVAITRAIDELVYVVDQTPKQS